jgi:hypothetical protein
LWLKITAFGNGVGPTKKVQNGLKTIEKYEKNGLEYFPKKPFICYTCWRGPLLPHGMNESSWEVNLNY